MSNEKAVFGYGSLILPMSTISRFDEELGKKVEEISSNSDNRLKDLLDFYLKEKQVERYEETELKFLPAKIHGFRRYYALEMEDEGNQLTAVEGDEDEFINGVIIYPLSDEEYQGIAGTEEGYSIQRISKEEIEFYVEPDSPEEIASEAVFFTGTDHDLINMETEKTRDPNYTNFIEKGVEMFAEKYFESDEARKAFRDQFMQDFKQHTYERHNKEWVKLSKLQ